MRACESFEQLVYPSIVYTSAENQLSLRAAEKSNDIIYDN